MLWIFDDEAQCVHASTVAITATKPRESRTRGELASFEASLEALVGAAVSVDVVEADTLWL